MGKPYTSRPASSDRGPVRWLAAAALLCAVIAGYRSTVREAPAPVAAVPAPAPRPAPPAARPAPPAARPAPVAPAAPAAALPAPRAAPVRLPAPAPPAVEAQAPSDCVPPGREDRRACVSETDYGGGMPPLRPGPPVPAVDGVFAEVLGTVVHTLPSAVMPGDGTCGGRGYLYVFRNRGGTDIPPLTLAGREGGVRRIPRLHPGDTCLIQTPSLLHSVDGPVNDSLHGKILDPMQKAYRSIMKSK